MYKISAHTMSTPLLSLEQAILLYDNIGFDGAEIIIANDYKCALKINSSVDEINKIKNLKRNLKIKISNLVPYTKNFNSNDKNARQQSIDEFKSIIDIADILDCPSVRIWSGIDPNGEEYSEKSYGYLVESLSIVGEYLNNSSITANVENHHYTEGTTALKTFNLVTNINSNNIGILYDPGNLIYLGDKDYLNAFEVQKNLINHVHLKDLTINENTNPQITTIGKNKYPVGSTKPCLFGEGEIPWKEIINLLKQNNYNKYISIEYEKRWHPEVLLDPEEALPIEIKKLQNLND